VKKKWSFTQHFNLWHI